MNSRLRIAWLYPDLMSTYGDRGNVIALRKRCEWRNIPVEVVPVTLETATAKLASCDIVFMGGAQDRQQKLAGEDFIRRKGPIVKKMVEKGTPALFVCAAYQFVGRYYKPYQGDPIPGAGIWDLITEHPGDQAKRLIGNTVAEIINPPELAGTTIVGFENHGGYTTLGAGMKPLAKVISGGGNNGSDGYEGATYKNSIGSYFHGPLLPKNPAIADWLLSKVVGQLAPLDDALEHEANASVR
ncbi:MAG: type 1 glutamine amidotransferase [Patescibacteria group bacterium]